MLALTLPVQVRQVSMKREGMIACEGYFVKVDWFLGVVVSCAVACARFVSILRDSCCCL